MLVNVLVVIVQIRIIKIQQKHHNHHQQQQQQKITQKSKEIKDAVVLVNVLAVVALVKCAIHKYFCFTSQCDMNKMVDMLNNYTGQSKRTNCSRSRNSIFLSFKCPVLNFINFSYATTTSAVIAAADCWSTSSSFIPNEQEISHRTNNILSLSSTLFPVSTERQLVIIICIIDNRKDFVIIITTTTNNNNNNNTININNNNKNNHPDADDAMVKYFNNKTIYNFSLILFIFNDCHLMNIFIFITILYLVANYDFLYLISNLHSTMTTTTTYVEFIIISIQSHYYHGELHRFNFDSFNTNLIAIKRWTHMMRCSALKNSMIFAL